MVKWNFPSNNNGQIAGINDSGVTTFRGQPLRYLVREICQNSLDARAGGEPVIVEFSRFDLPVSAIPGNGDLNLALKASKQFWSGQQEKKTVDFFDNALRLINGVSIPVLRISDYNTTGLQGSRKTFNTDWYNLIKSAGVSDKHPTAGGSFGIGKFAPFVCSDLRTVFYSTLDLEGYVAYQGVSRLVSFKDRDGDITQGIGYYGWSEKNTPVFEQIALDPDHQRTSPGTDIFILGFKTSNRAGDPTFSDEERDEMITSVIDGFFWAIWKNQLVVRIEDEEINSKSLPDFIQKYKGQFSENADNYYEALISPDAQYFEEEDFLGMGKISMYLLIKDGFHRKAAMVRGTGMKILDRMRISGHIPFAAVVYLEGEKLNTYFRALENPSHTDWEPGFADNPKEAKKAEENIRILNRWIRENLNKALKSGSNEQLDVEGLGQFLPDIEDLLPSKTRRRSKGNATDKVVEVIHRRPTAIQRKSDDDGYEGSTLVPGQRGGTNDMPEKGKHPTERVGKGLGKEVESGRSVPYGSSRVYAPTLIKYKSMRLFCTDATNGTYRIMLTPEQTAHDGLIQVVLSGEEKTKISPNIMSATLIGKQSPLTVENGKISGLSFEAGQAISLEFVVESPQRLSMEVEVYGHTS